MRSNLPTSPDPSRTVFGTMGLIGLLLAVFASFYQGQKAGLGFLLGLVGIGLSIVGTWMAVKWIGKVLADQSPTWQGSVVPVAAMVIKLPAILLSMSWAQRLGPPAPGWFLVGMALVYSGLIWWAVSRQRGHQE